MIRGIKSRILLEYDVINGVDKHTNKDDTLDNDISCILEEVNSALLMGSKAAMSKLVSAVEPRYDFHVGDYVEDIEGNVGYIDFICDCDKCKERKFNEPRIRYTSGETDYITVHQLENLEKSYRRIGKYEFSKKQPVVKSIDSIVVNGTTDEDEEKLINKCMDLVGKIPDDELKCIEIITEDNFGDHDIKEKEFK